jgi:hypothetical protein
MPDDDVPRDRAGTEGAAHGDGLQPDDQHAFDLASLFDHHEDDVSATPLEDFSALFAGPGDVAPTEKRAPASEESETVDPLGAGTDADAPVTPAPGEHRDPDDDLDLHLQAPTALIDTAEGHLFDDAATEAHPYTHSFPAPVPARPEPQHAAPRYGLGRPQAIAMAAGLVVTALGVGWALATPGAPVPVAVSATPTSSVDPARIAKVNAAVDSLDGAVKAAQTSADTFASPLAAMAGSSDESARLAAEAARQAYVAALAAVKVPTSAGKSATNVQLDQLEREVASREASLTAATAGFRGAITTFRQSVPGYAATAVADNPDAAEPFRTAATETAAAVAASDPFGAMSFAPWDAWRSALAALIADQARAVAESDSSGSGGSGDTGTGTGGGTTTEPTTAPATEPPPAPTDPGPTTPPTTTPTP